MNGFVRTSDQGLARRQRSLGRSIGLNLVLILATIMLIALGGWGMRRALVEMEKRSK